MGPMIDVDIKGLGIAAVLPVMQKQKQGLGCSADATPARDIMTEIRKQNEVAMRERFLQMNRLVFARYLIPCGRSLRPYAPYPHQ